MPPPERSIICPILIGRQPDLQRLELLAAQAFAGRGQIALISGEAGIGKSRLVAELKARATGRALILEGACFETDAALPYAPLLDLFRGYFSAQPAASLRGLFGPFAADLAALFPELAADAADLPVTPGQDQQRLFLGFAHALTRLARDQPLLIVFEDLHWSDAASLAFLALLARRLAAQPIGLILTYRTDEPNPALTHLLAELDRARAAAEFELRRLNPAEVDAMLRAIFELKVPVRQDFLEALYALAEGNPFFIEETLKSLSVAGDIYYSGGQWDRKELSQLRIPRSVQDAIQRRTRELSAPARRVLELAAVAGRRFDVRLLQMVLDVAQDELAGLLKILISAQLVVENSADQFAFRHALTRQAVYASLLGLERQAAHRALGEALERLPGSAGSLPLADLSYHFFEAGEWARALDYSRQAGARAQAVYAPREALVYFSRALEAGRRLARPAPAGLLRARGKAHEALGNFEAARADFAAAQAAALEQADRLTEWQSLIDLGALWAGRDYQTAGAYFQQAEALARDPAGAEAAPLRAESLNRLGNWWVNVGRVADGLAAHRQALALFEQQADPAGLANTYDLLGMASLHAGDQVASYGEYQRAIAHYRAVDDRPGLAAALIGACHASYWDDVDHVPAQSYAENRDAAAEALALVRGLEAQAAQAYVLWSSSLGLANHGALGAALAEAQESLQIATAIEHRQWIAGARYALGHANLQLLQAGPAILELEAGLQLARELGSAWWIGNLSADLGQAHLLNDAPAAARRVLHEALARYQDDRTLIGRRLQLAHGALLLAEGQPAEALAVAERLLNTLRRAEASQPVPALWFLKGRALAALQDAGAAEQALLAARRGAEARQAQPLLWPVCRSLGWLLAQQKRKAEAQAVFDQAQQVLRAVRATIPDAALADRFEHAALATLPAPRMVSARRAAADRFGGLTSRERQVAQALSQGKSNRDIAEALVLSERTVENHVSHILSKLGLDSRLQVVAWAADSGLGKDDA